MTTNADTKITLDSDQLAALNCLKNKLSIITGGPGTGKSFLIKTICNLLDVKNLSYYLCAPTGKAAKRMAEATGRDAYTIHRLLGAGYYGEWEYNKYNQIDDVNYVIIDEISMCDLMLFWRTLQAFTSETRFILVGDQYQLPSVGPGSVLRDLIRSGRIPVYKLTQNHRQAKGSLIAHNAQLINSGYLKLVFGEDLNFIEATNPILIREKLPKLVRELGKEYDLIKDFWVLSPQKETTTGVYALNDMLRYIINPKANAYEKFSVGDKVMQILNNYQLNIFNGYMGVIVDVDSRYYHINFFDADKNSKALEYPRTLVKDQLIHAFCCTIHKSQGSEAKCGILIMSSSHTFMHNRNLLYTGLTRFKEKCVILGDPLSLKRSINNNIESDRYSKLADRISGKI